MNSVGNMRQASTSPLDFRRTDTPRGGYKTKKITSARLFEYVFAFLDVSMRSLPQPEASIVVPYIDSATHPLSRPLETI
jgi:hypothetical protein